MHIERTSRPGIKNTPVLQLHKPPEDRRRRELYDPEPLVDDVELERLWSTAQSALEDLALALPPLDSSRQSMLICADMCRTRVEASKRNRGRG